MEVSATLLALMVGAISLMRYYSRKDNTFLFLATGFLGAAFLDGYHAICTSEAFRLFMPSEDHDLISWSWLASRQFLSIFIFLSWLAWTREQKMGREGCVSERGVFTFAALSTLFVLLFFAYAPLPQTFHSDYFVIRPLDLIPAVFFVLAFAGYLHKGAWRIDIFDHWLVLSLIVSLAGQVGLMAFSASHFDPYFNMAHLLKILSYLCVLTGLLIGMYTFFQRATERSHDLNKAKRKLDQVHARLITSVNSMRNGFAIWDEEDRLVLANDAYLRFYEPIADMIVEGVRYQDILSAGFEKNVWKNSDQLKRDWLREQMAERRTQREIERELVLADGRQLVFDEHVLSNGELITTVIDVSAHRQREMELQETKDQLEHIAYYDNLTGLANRTHCQKDLAEKFAFAGASKKWAIILIDLDKFKRINDTLGHATGDYLLKRIGERFQLLTREIPGFEIYRWGGDEFIALVERNKNTDLDMICQELTDLAGIPLEFDSKVLRPTVSLGVAHYPEDAHDLEALMIFADLALYKTKELGRDGYQFFSSELKAAVDKEARIEHELREAIIEGQLELFYQPQINIKDESITGLEALLRWNHPNRGLISPGEFLPVAESAGLATAIGRLVFEHAAQAVRHWLDKEIDFGRLAVNLSPKHLKEGELLRDFFDALDHHVIAPRYFSVEVLESFLLDDPHANIKDILSHLRERDVHVELDDFGTGYASLSHLSTMPISGLKIDRSFLHKVVEDPTQQGIVSALISISKLMNLHVICEGIETQAQVEAISSIGNCSIQGFFIAKPMRFHEVTRWMREERNKGLLDDLPDYLHLQVR